ncbi:hypothetical protein AB1Y20_019844 [Prymnesium parvum]|uniref:Fe2OG dioxygenase domain-containing protein n=1 Tax=Prymnesium parvum TaxID=97485 RepID=A0AB34JVA7_PRYPA
MATLAPAHCAAALEAWCDQHCPHAVAHGPLKARYDRSATSEMHAWRCYATSTLDAMHERYAQGTAYCTRHAQLVELLQQCLNAEVQPSHASIDPQGNVHIEDAAVPDVSDSVLMDGSGGLAVELPRWPGGDLTIPAVDTSNWTPSESNELFRVQGWQVECINDFERHKLNNYTGNVSRRKAFLKRDGLSCYGPCVRGVVDGFASHAEVLELSVLEPYVPPGQASSITTWRWDVADDPPVFRTLVNRAQAVLREHFGVENLRFYRSNIITWKAPRSSHETTPPIWRPRSLHGDTNTDEMFLFTTILYLSQHGEDCVGAETGIADEIGAQDVVTAGLRVQPSIGRLLVFSAGVENMHEMLRLVRGKRVAIQMWFACKGQNPGWARAQRVSWNETYGFGGPESGSSPSKATQQAPAISNALLSTPPWRWRAA